MLSKVLVCKCTPLFTSTLLSAQGSFVAGFNGAQCLVPADSRCSAGADDHVQSSSSSWEGVGDKPSGVLESDMEEGGGQIEAPLSSDAVSADATSEPLMSHTQGNTTNPTVCPVFASCLHSTPLIKVPQVDDFVAF